MPRGGCHAVVMWEVRCRRPDVDGEERSSQAKQSKLAAESSVGQKI
jgi:hypothetical protein